MRARSSPPHLESPGGHGAWSHREVESSKSVGLGGGGAARGGGQAAWLSDGRYGSGALPSSKAQSTML